ncbi:hypothetical protein BpHYR1_032833 [Brachionus plicatilis]|uniref:Uncharacterized protein n=1 Tax=Brachionus plicatilis TaxID=10195 RepID=A0A3M7QMQ1_BRAPC|nr:hypothetical protein BpHYR1_032833 [Brachionus plicatilis]
MATLLLGWHTGLGRISRGFLAPLATAATAVACLAGSGTGAIGLTGAGNGGGAGAAVLAEAAGSVQDDEAVLELEAALVLDMGGTRMAVPDDVMMKPPWFMLGMELSGAFGWLGLAWSSLVDSLSDVSFDDDELFKLDDDESFFSSSELRCSSSIIFSLSSSNSLNFCSCSNTELISDDWSAAPAELDIRSARAPDTLPSLGFSLKLDDILLYFHSEQTKIGSLDHFAWTHYPWTDRQTHTQRDTWRERETWQLCSSTRIIHSLAHSSLSYTYDQMENKN